MTLVLKLKVPKGSTRQDIKEYVNDAVSSWGNSFCPGTEYEDANPLFDFERNIISIKEIKDEK